MLEFSQSIDFNEFKNLTAMDIGNIDGFLLQNVLQTATTDCITFMVMMNIPSSTGFDCLFHHKLTFAIND